MKKRPALGRCCGKRRVRRRYRKTGRLVAVCWKFAAQHPDEFTKA